VSTFGSTLLFSLTMTQVLDSSSCEFAAGYLDNVTLGDSVDILIEEVKQGLRE